MATAGCGYYKANRAVARGRRVIAQREKDVEDLEKVRGELRRVIDMKIKAAQYLESSLRLLGTKYMEVGSYSLAKDALAEAELLQPYNAFIKKDLGECYYFLALSTVDSEERQASLEMSGLYYRKSLDIKPDLLEARYGYGLLLAFGYDDWGSAIEQVKLMLDYDPENIDAHFALGRFYYEIGDLGKALNEYLTLTRLLPRSSPRQKKVEENILRINRETGIDER
jgi:cytochrome c-type biogenesis protein CcmH/NrfG